MDDEQERREDFQRKADEHIAEVISAASGITVDHPEDFYRLLDRRIALLRRGCWVCRLQARLDAHVLHIARWYQPFCMSRINQPRRLALVLLPVAVWTLLVRMVGRIVRWMPCVEGCRQRPPKDGGDEREE